MRRTPPRLSLRARVPHRALGLALAGAAAGVLALGGGAAAAGGAWTCSFDPETHVVTLAGPADPETVGLARGDEGRIEHDGTPCGDATVESTARVEIRPGPPS